jgi:hypothetical protein
VKTPRKIIRSLALSVLVITLAGCVMPDGQVIGVAPAAITPVAIYDDPFAYCAAVGAVDEPTESFGAPAGELPEVVALGLRAAFGTDDAPLEMFQRNAAWRCMDGKVYACAIGANIPCWSKADSSTTPSEAMEAYCQEYPESEFLPAVVTGRQTIYSWRCTDGKAVIHQQQTEVDARGYPTIFWHEISPQE